MRHSAKHVGLRNQQSEASLFTLLTPFPYKPNQHANLNPLSPMQTPNYPHALQPIIPIDALYPPTCPTPTPSLIFTNNTYLLHRSLQTTPRTLQPLPLYLITIQSHPISDHQPLPLNRHPNRPPHPPFPSQRTKHLNSAWIS